MNGPGRALSTEEQHLQKLDEGISNFLATGNMSYATNVSLYREVYLLCRVLENELRSEDKLDNVLDLLANNIKEYVKQNVQKRLSHLRDPIVLLKQYEKEWNLYSRQIQTIHNIYSPLNGKSTDTKKRTVKSRLLEVWRDGVLNQNITQSLLDLLQRERNEEATDTNQISNTVQSLITLDQYIYENHEKQFPQNMYVVLQSSHSLGKSDQTNVPSQLPNYRQFFEDPFLEATRVYYSTEATNFLSQNPNIADYVKKVEIRVQQESIRGSMYLHKSTAQNLEQLCEKVLITTYQKEIQSGVRTLLYRAEPDQPSIELRGTYNLLNRVKGLHPLLIELEDFAVSEARGHLETLLSKSQQQSPKVEPDKAVDPKDYAEILINTYSRVRQLVTLTFNNDPLFVAALDKACKKFVNTNPICTVPSKSPDLLARYTDSLLSKGTRNNYAEGERLLNEVFHVLRYLEEKDVFVHIASKCCARRFIYDTFDPDLMGLAISKLKEVFGIEYTGKLQRMFTDIQLNRDLKDKFRDWCGGFASSAGEVINALVLTSGSWPLSLPSTEGGFHAPAEILNLQNTFTAWYLGAFSGRKLLWLPQHSRSSVQYRHSMCSKTYTLQLGDDYLLACLLLFNDAETLTVEEVMAATSLSGPAVASVIRALQKNKILDQPLLSNDVETPDRGFAISLNKKFVSKNLRITIHRPPPVASSSSSSRPLTDPEIDQERKIKIQAALVRVMKARKILSHAELVTEVQLQLSRYFNPKPSIVKQGIECVIENGYLERDPHNKDKYLYKA